MAATLAATRPWEQAQRPQTQPQPQSDGTRRGDRKSPNRVKAKPANPIVINTILESFDALTPPPILSTDEAYLNAMSSRPRPYTADETITSSPSLRPVSHGFGMEYGRELSMNDESGLSHAALPPTIGTSRDSFGVATYKPTRGPSLWSANGDEMKRSSSLNSRSSSSWRKRRERPTKYKLSSESWVKQGLVSQESLSNDWSRDDAQSSIRHASSQESLRPPKSRIELIPTPSLSSTMSRAEQIIALTPAPKRTSSRRRIYLTDTGSNDSQSTREPSQSIAEAPELEEREVPPLPLLSEDLGLLEDRNLTLDDNLMEQVKLEGEQVEFIPTRRSPEKTNSIVDSIPMRTSSLRQSSSSPGRSRKKERKSKRKSEVGRLAKMRAGSQRDSFVSTSSREISDSTWNDLGEDDETVKRIRELRERRHARMLEPKASFTRGVSPAAYSEISTTSTAGQPSIYSKGSPVLRPEAPRSVTEPSPLSQRVLPVESELLAPELNGHTSRLKASDYSPGAKRPIAKYSLDETRPPRPLSMISNTSSNAPLSLDYSYADAVDALHGVRRDIQKRSANSPISPTFPLTPIRNAPLEPIKTESPKSASTASA